MKAAISGKSAGKAGVRNPKFKQQISTPLLSTDKPKRTAKRPK